MFRSEILKKAHYKNAFILPILSELWAGEKWRRNIMSRRFDFRNSWETEIDLSWHGKSSLHRESTPVHWMKTPDKCFIVRLLLYSYIIFFPCVWSVFPTSNTSYASLTLISPRSPQCLSDSCHSLEWVKNGIDTWHIEIITQDLLLGHLPNPAVIRQLEGKSLRSFLFSFLSLPLIL